MVIRIVICLLLLTGCQPAWIRKCPEPETVKLRKASAHRLKLYRYRMKERAEANQTAESYELLRRSSRDVKDPRFIEVWECAIPGARHDRMIKARRAKLEKRYAQRMKQLNKEKVQPVTSISLEEVEPDIK